MMHAFQRFTAAGNTFVVMNTWEDPLSLSREEMRTFVRAACDYKTGIGADGVILINQPRRRAEQDHDRVEQASAPAVAKPSPVAHNVGSASFRMDFYNPDGTTGMLCGNGARCAVEAAREFELVEGNETTFEVLGATNRAQLLPNGDIRVYFQDPVDIRLNFEIPLEKEQHIHASYVDLGSQHIVVLFRELASPDVLTIEDFNIAHYGALLRWHPEFAPLGANANFIEVREDGEEKYLRIRTFERGVEGETLACGTGCMSSAIMARLTGLIPKTPIRLLTQSGEFVTVNFRVNNHQVSNLSLEGSVVSGEAGTLRFDEATGTLHIEYLP